MEHADNSRVAAELSALLGSDRVRPPQGREGKAARLIVEPANCEELAQVVRKCEADRHTLAPLGSARTLGEIRREPVDVGVWLGRMNRLVAYEPDDMTIVAQAGVLLGPLNRQIAARGQRLPCDPAEPDSTVIGALIAAAGAGPIRHSEGTVRDLLLGVRFIGHGGRTVHGGGRVVKNVAGYDLMKVMAGSFGTLGIITEAAFKVRRIPANYTLALAHFDHHEQAFRAASVLNDSLPLIHLDVLSPALSVLLSGRTAYALVAGFGGNRTEAGYLCTRMREIVGPGLESLEGAPASAAYEGLRDLDIATANLVAQLAVPASELGPCLSELGVEFRAHAGCGVAQLYSTAETAPGSAVHITRNWREIAHRARGNLRLLRAAPANRDGLEFFDQPSAAALNLMRRMKATFDPAGIFNPGCFVGGL